MKKILFLILVLATTPATFVNGQSLKTASADRSKPRQAGVVWTKTVSRTVFVGDTEKTGPKKLTNEGDDLTLFETFTDAVVKGKVIAYSNFDTKFSTPLSKNHLNEMRFPKPDTLDVEDPVTGKIIRKLIAKDPAYGNISRYSILEEWTFDRTTGKTNVQIIGIAPIRMVYDSDGQFRGMQNLFWLKYTDVKELVAQYEQTHANANLFLSVWNDYFSEPK